MARTKGLAPSKRKLATTAPTHTIKKKLTANQWQNTPQQNYFMEYWTQPTSDTFGNAYQSALKAKYAPHYARQLTAPITLNKWITEYKNRVYFTDEHIRQGIQQIAKQANNSRSPDDTRLKGYEILAKVSGMLDNKNQVNITVVQPILGGASKSTNPRVVIDQPTDK